MIEPVAPRGIITRRLPLWVVGTLDFLMAFCLAACGPNAERPEPQIITVDRPVPVASPCVPATLGPALDYPDTDAALRAAPDAAERYRLIAQARPLRILRLSELEAVVAGCPKEERK